EMDNVVTFTMGRHIFVLSKCGLLLDLRLIDTYSYKTQNVPMIGKHRILRRLLTNHILPISLVFEGKVYISRQDSHDVVVGMPVAEGFHFAQLEMTGTTSLEPAIFIFADTDGATPSIKQVKNQNG
ncbi:hypothetical protein PFISCL1PPCAC_2797, partial [Pristionchus fissidentatus]